MYRRILLPIDGSSFSLAAARHVTRVLEDGGHVLVLEVIDSEAQILAQTSPAGFPLDGMGISADIARQAVQAQREEAMQHLAEARGLLEYGGARDVETRVVAGVPGPLIVQTARDEGCDLVVMATHGRSGLARALMGSVAEHVLRHLSGIPVLLIHPESADEERPKVPPAGEAASTAPSA